MNIKDILVIFTIVIGIPVLVASNHEIIKNLFFTKDRFQEAKEQLETAKKEEHLLAINSLEEIAFLMWWKPSVNMFRVGRQSLKIPGMIMLSRKLMYKEP